MENNASECRPQPARVLIVLLGAIGDVVRALPLAQRLRSAWPASHITWAVEPPSAPVLCNHPALDEVIRFERGNGVKAFFRFLSAVRANRPDLTLDLQRHLKSGLTSRCSGGRVRLGFHPRNSREGNWLFNTEYISPVERFTSKLGHFQRFADHLGVPEVPVSFGLRSTPQERARVAERIRGLETRFAAVYVGSTWPSRRWFPASTAALCQQLRARDVSAVILGGPGDVAFASSVLAAGAGDVTNLAGQTSLREAIAILEQATVAIGPDSGLMHIAAAVGTPVVSLWGATSAARSAPFGSESLVIEGDVPCAPCYLRRCPIGQLCMEAITPQAVLSRVDVVLSGEQLDRETRPERNHVTCRFSDGRGRS